MTLTEGDILLIAGDLDKAFRHPDDYCHFAYLVEGQPEYSNEGYLHVVLKVLR